MNDVSPVCIVTGASSGIGLEAVSQFARLGYRVALCARRSERLADAVRRLIHEGATPDRVHTATVDVGNANAVATFIQGVHGKFGRIDLLVNNAGTATLAPIAEFSLADFEQQIAVHVRAVFAATKAVWPVMQAQGNGCIITVSSMSSVDPFPGFGVYGACKAWGEHFTRATAEEGRACGIRTHALRIGAVDTPLLRSLFPDFPVSQTLSPQSVAMKLVELATQKGIDRSGEAVTFIPSRDASASDSSASHAPSGESHSHNPIRVSEDGACK